MKDNFEIPVNILENNKARFNFSIKDATLLPGSSILEAQVVISSKQQWKVKEIILTINRREYNQFFFYTRGRYATYRNKAEFHKSYEIWKDSNNVNKYLVDLSMFNFKYPVPITNNTPPSFHHENIQHEFKDFLEYYVMVSVISADTEKSLIMTLPIRMLSISNPQPGLSNSKNFDLTYCCCMSNGTINENLSIADPNLSFNKLNISADFLLDNTQSSSNIISITFSIIEIFHAVGISNFENCCEGGNIPNFNENIVTLKTIVGIPKGQKKSGQIELVLPSEIVQSSDFGTSNGVCVKKTYVLRMTPVFDPAPSADTSVSCLLNAAQIIQGILNDTNLHENSINEGDSSKQNMMEMNQMHPRLFYNLVTPMHNPNQMKIMP